MSIINGQCKGARDPPMNGKNEKRRKDKGTHANVMLINLHKKKYETPKTKLSVIYF